MGRISGTDVEESNLVKIIKELLVDPLVESIVSFFDLMKTVARELEWHHQYKGFGLILLSGIFAISGVVKGNKFDKVISLVIFFGAAIIMTVQMYIWSPTLREVTESE